MPIHINVWKIDKWVNTICMTRVQEENESHERFN